jgi:hypothetical protein
MISLANGLCGRQERVQQWHGFLKSCVNMQNLRRVAAVIADGKVFEAAERQALLDAVVRDAEKAN